MYKKLILFITISILFIDFTNATSNGLFVNNMTIKELGKNVEQLKEQEKKIIEETKESWKDYKELNSFIKQDLSKKELEEIKLSIESYIQIKDELESLLKFQIDNLENTEDTKKQIIQEQANFYKYLAKYIDIWKRDDFIEHIKYNILATKERKDLIEEILKNQNLIDKKVSYLKDKIETHKEELSNQIQESITTKILERIEQIDKDEKYKWIKTEVKNKIYNDFIKKIKEKIKDLEKSTLSQSYIETRSLIYNTMIKNIESKIKK